MSTSYSFSTSFTRTHARYLASKVAADLRQMQLFYGRPGDAEIADYIEELTELLVGGFLASVDYGFRRYNGWVVALSYSVRSDGTLTADDRAGRVPVGADITGASWYSYLRYSAQWGSLTQSERERIKNSIPVGRGGADEPQIGSGNIWVEDKVYTSSGTSFTRRTLKSL
jgi:Bacterial HORMA domain family 1